MDIRETKRKVHTEKHFYMLEHNYVLDNNYALEHDYCKINGVEFIPRSQTIYIVTFVNKTNGVEIIMNLNIEDCNGVTIAHFQNIDVNKINTYDFDEELLQNLLIIRDEIEKKEKYYNNKIKKTK